MPTELKVEKLMTLREAAALLRMGPRLLQSHIDRGDITFIVKGHGALLFAAHFVMEAFDAPATEPEITSSDRP
jgi:hypothetical protein